jgi:CBS domain-containing protein
MVQDVITANVQVCHPETDLQSVAKMMVKHDCGAIPVVGAGAKSRPLGIVTDRDIVARSVAKGEDPARMHAAAAMTSGLITIRRDADLEHAMQLMKEHQVRRLVVVDESDNLAGILSLGDVVRARPDQQSIRAVEAVSQPSPGASGPAQEA